MRPVSQRKCESNPPVIKHQAKFAITPAVEKKQETTEYTGMAN